MQTLLSDTINFGITPRHFDPVPRVSQCSGLRARWSIPAERIRDPIRVEGAYRVIETMAGKLRTKLLSTA